MVVRGIGRVILMGVVSAMGSGAAVAATRQVPSGYMTINAALDASSPGDTVLVAPGVYDQFETRLLGDGHWFSSVAFLRGGVTLLSQGGASVTTLRLDAGTTPDVVRAFGESGTIEIRGFTLTGSQSMNCVSISESDHIVVQDCVFVNPSGPAVSLRGISTVRVDVEVYRCRFEGMHSNVNSGGISETSGTLTVEDSEFLYCRSGAISLGYDAGFPHATGLVMRRCRFVGNLATNGAGGAVSVGSYATGVIEDCWFERNGASVIGGAVYVFGAGSAYTVRNSVLVGNTVHGEAAAIYSNGMSVVIEGNTFVDNETTLPQVFGGAVSLRGTGQRTVRRNVAVNSMGDPAFYIASTSGLTEGCNVFWDNGWGNAQGFTPSATDLEADPLFCDSAMNDFHVGAGSPCIPGSGHPSCTDLIGAWGEGCGTVAIPPTTWGKVKSEFRTEVRP